MMASTPAHDIVTTTFVGLLGVGVFTFLAGLNDQMGTLVVILMWGFFLGWALLHTSELGDMVKAL